MSVGSGGLMMLPPKGMPASAKAAPGIAAFHEALLSGQLAEETGLKGSRYCRLEPVASKNIRYSRGLLVDLLGV